MATTTKTAGEDVSATSSVEVSQSDKDVADAFLRGERLPAGTSLSFRTVGGETIPVVDRRGK